MHSWYSSLTNFHWIKQLSWKIGRYGRTASWPRLARRDTLHADDARLAFVFFRTGAGYAGCTNPSPSGSSIQFAKILGVLNAYTNTFNFIRPYALLRFVPVQFVHILLLRFFRKSPERGKYPYMCTAVRGTRAPIARYMMT